MTDKVSGLDSRLVDTASTAVHDGSPIGGVPGRKRDGEARAMRNISRPGAIDVPGGPGHLVGVCGEKASASTWGTRMDQWPGLTLRQDGRTTSYEIGGISDGSKGATSNGRAADKSLP